MGMPSTNVPAGWVSGRPQSPNPEVEVWDYLAQQFIRSYRCEGEQRIRVDYHGDLKNLAVFEVTRAEGEVFYPVDGTNPLDGWVIDLT